VSFEITCPSAANQPHNVVPSGSGSPGAGVICAGGDLGEEHREKPVTVYALVVSSFDPSDARYIYPPNGAAKAQLYTNGSWQANPVSGALYGQGSALPTNTLIAWLVSPGSGSGRPFRRTRPFLGLQATSVDCCQGSGSASGQQMFVQSQAGAGVALAMAPVLWNLVATGFESEWAPFNGNWVLALRDVPGTYCVWDNQGDGIRIPRVVLRCERPLAVSWELTLLSGGETILRYARPATEWNPLTANMLRCSGNADAPQQLTIIPG
jgi:hypothetical protein